MLPEEIAKNYTKDQLSVSKRMSVSVPLILWYHVTEPMMLRRGYKGKLAQSNYMNDALRHYNAYCAEQEGLIKDANLVPSPEMMDELNKALAAEEKDE